MTVAVTVFIEGKDAEGTETSQYTSNGCTSIIDKFTALNHDTAIQSITVRLVRSGGTAAASNAVVLTKFLQPGEDYAFPSVVGHSLSPGGFISTLASAGSVISIRASGRQVT